MVAEKPPRRRKCKQQLLKPESVQQHKSDKSCIHHDKPAKKKKKNEDDQSTKESKACHHILKTEGRLRSQDCNHETSLQKTVECSQNILDQIMQAQDPIHVNGCVFKQVNQHRTLLTSDGNCHKEIRTMIVMEKVDFCKMETIFTKRMLSKIKRTRVLKYEC